MPAATSKRLRGIKVTRHFIIGSEAHVLPHPDYPSPGEGHTKGWKVYVRPLPNGPDITTWLKKVQFKLHMTYAEPSRTVEAPDAFEVKETGYGEFAIEIRLYFAPESGEKAVYREHYLILGPYGGKEQMERQERENRIVAERLETIEFNEPTADFFKTLVSEEQFNWLKVKKGRGKGKKPDFVFEGKEEPTAELPERPDAGGGSGGLGSGGAWNRQYEKQTLSQLDKSRKALEDMLEEERRRADERKRQLEELEQQIEAK